MKSLYLKKKKSLQPCIVIHCHLLPLLSFTIKLLQPVLLSIIQSGHMPHGSTYLHPLSLPFTSDHQIQRAFFSTSQHLCIFCYTVPLLTLKCHLFFFFALISTSLLTPPFNFLTSFFPNFQMLISKVI